MKYLLLFIMFLTLTSVYSFNDSGNYVLKNNGEKVLIHPAFFKLDQANEFIIYRESAIAKEVKLKFSEFKYVIIKNLKFVTINFGRSNGYQGFFVLCENSIHTLVFKVEDLSESSEIKYYRFYILDQNNTIVEEHKFDNTLSNKSISQRNDIFGKINFFFNSCTNFAKKLVALENSEPESKSLSILELFEQPMFYDCK